MTAKEWKAKAKVAADVVELSLPSGMVLTARRPGPLQLATWDRLPMLLAAASSAGAGQGIGDEEMVEVARFLRELLIYCCVAPRVSATPAEDEISPRDIPEADWTFIVRWAMRSEEAESLRSFRGRGTDDRGASAGEAVFERPIAVDGDRGPGTGTRLRPGGGAAGGGDEGRG